MSRLHKYFSVLFCVALLLATSIVNARPLGGTYNVKGTNPGGKSSYTGTAKITAAKNGNYVIHWKVGSVYDGVGILQGDTFKVNWGNLANPEGGVVTYTVDPNGTLKGIWYTFKNPNTLGTETLIPR